MWKPDYVDGKKVNKTVLPRLPIAVTANHLAAFKEAALVKGAPLIGWLLGFEVANGPLKDHFLVIDPPMLLSALPKKQKNFHDTLWGEGAHKKPLTAGAPRGTPGCTRGRPEGI